MTANSFSVIKNIIIDHINNQEWLPAIESATELAKYNPFDIEILNIIAVCYTKINRPHEAISMFRRIILAEPANKEILYRFAVLAEHSGYRDDALAAYRGIITLSQNHINMPALLGIFRIAIKKIEDDLTEDTSLLMLPMINDTIIFMETHAIDQETRTSLAYFIISHLHEFTDLCTEWAAEIKRSLLDAGQGTVLSGLYSGMRLSDRFIEHCSLLEIIGLADNQLNDVILSCKDNINDSVFVIGAGIGYHAIGLSGILPKARIIYWEKDAERLSICQEMANINNTADRSDFFGDVDPDQLVNLLEKFNNPLVFINIGGEEVDLLDKFNISCLHSSNLIIECNEHSGVNVSSIISGIISGTHDINLFNRRYIDAWKVSCLSQFDPIRRWLAVYDSALAAHILAYNKNWIYARPRSRSS